MVRVLAPVAPCLAEEVFDQLVACGHLHVKAASVFHLDWPKVPTEWMDPVRVAQGICCRASGRTSTRPLTRSSEPGTAGSSDGWPCDPIALTISPACGCWDSSSVRSTAQVHLTLRHPANELGELGEADLAEALMVASVARTIDDQLPRASIVKVEDALGALGRHKCPRCWMSWAPHPEALCPRCAAVLDAAGAE